MSYATPLFAGLTSLRPRTDRPWTMDIPRGHDQVTNTIRKSDNFLQNCRIPDLKDNYRYKRPATIKFVQSCVPYNNTTSASKHAICTSNIECPLVPSVKGHGCTEVTPSRNESPPATWVPQCISSRARCPLIPRFYVDDHLSCEQPRVLLSISFYWTFQVL